MDNSSYFSNRAFALAALAAPVANALRVSGQQPQPSRSFVPPNRPFPEKLGVDGMAASLAGGIIAASGKPHTIEEALEVFRAVREGLL